MNAADATGREPRRRRRWWIWALGGLVAVGLLAGAGELALRAIIPTVVANEVRDQLGLAPEHPVEVQLEGSTVLSALTGSVGPIEVGVPDVPVLGDITATISASADSVPFNPSRGEITGGSASVTIPAESIGAVVALVTDGFADTGEVRGNQILVGRTMELFGQTVTLSVALGLAIDETGEVRITPASINAAGFDLTAEELNEVTGGSLSMLLGDHEFCVRDQLPEGVTLTAIRFSSLGSVTIDADFAPRILSDPAQQRPGECAPQNG